MSSDVRRDGVTLLDVTVFLAELVLLAVLAVAGARLGGSTAVEVLLAVGLPLVAAASWGALLAPSSSRRLRYPIRTVVKVDLFTAAAVLLGVSGLVVWAVGFWVVTVSLVVVAEVIDHRRETSPGS
jgi:Protein of unknown function (DUF2568)